MLGNNLEKLIKERKANKSDLCRYLEISRNTLQEYLSENTFMTSDKIVKTAVYFGVSVASLFGEEEDNYASLRDMLLNQQKQLNELNRIIKNILN